MKRFFLTLAIATMGFGPAFAASDYLFVEYDGNKERLRGLDRETMQVCELKARVASMFGLDMRRFNLRMNGRILNDSRTLADDNVVNGKTLTIQAVGSTTQC